MAVIQRVGPRSFSISSSFVIGIIFIISTGLTFAASFHYGVSYQKRHASATVLPGTIPLTNSHVPDSNPSTGSLTTRTAGIVSSFSAQSITITNRRTAAMNTYSLSNATKYVSSDGSASFSSVHVGSRVELKLGGTISSGVPSVQLIFIRSSTAVPSNQGGQNTPGTPTL